MTDWFRSLSTLALAFGIVMVATIGLGEIVVPAAGGATGPDDPAAPGGPGSAGTPVAAPQPSGPPTQLGGTLAFSGDRDGVLVLDRQTGDGRYSLGGSDGRLVFDGDPLYVDLISFDGWEFYLDPGECELTHGERHDPTGVAGATIRCEDVPELRDKGTVTIEGTVGVAADLFGLRGGLPESGGTLTLGNLTLTFEGAYLTLGGFGPFAGTIDDEANDLFIMFDDNPQNHAIVVYQLAFGGEDEVRLGEGHCQVTEEQIGTLNPLTRVSNLTIRCPSVEVPGTGTVPLEGTIVAEISEPG